MLRALLKIGPIVILVSVLLAPTPGWAQGYTDSGPQVPSFTPAPPPVIPSAIPPNTQVSDARTAVEQASRAGSAAQISTQRAQQAIAAAKACGLPTQPKCRSLWKQAEQAVGRAILLQKKARRLQQRANQLVGRLRAGMKPHGVPGLGFGGTASDPASAQLPGGNGVIEGVVSIRAGQPPTALPQTGGGAGGKSEQALLVLAVLLLAAGTVIGARNLAVNQIGQNFSRRIGPGGLR